VRSSIFDYGDCENAFKDVETPEIIQKSLLEAQKKKEETRNNYWKKVCPKEFGEPNPQEVQKTSLKKMFSVKDMVIPKRRGDVPSHLYPLEGEARARKNSF